MNASFERDTNNRASTVAGSARDIIAHATGRLPQLMAERVGTGTFPNVSTAKPTGLPVVESAIVAHIWADDTGYKVALIERPDTMSSFPGAIVFPGGKADPGEDQRAAGKREFREEMGTDITEDAVITVLPPVYRAGKGKWYEMSALVAWADKLPAYRPNPDEVKEIVVLPLSGTEPELALASERLSGVTRILYEALCEAIRTETRKDIELAQLRSLRTPLKIIVTSGGTRVPIDTVRELTNKSRGTTGAYVAEAALEHGHFVHYLCARDAKTPFESQLSWDPAKPYEQESERIQRDAHRIVPLYRSAQIERVPDFDTYRARFLELVKDSSMDAAIVTMAASDYGSKPVTGKISSDAPGMSIELHPLPKIISEVKKERKGILLVGFKLLINTPPDVLIERAYQNLLRDGQDLAVANVGTDSMKPTDLLTYIITPERAVIPVERDELPEKLLNLVEQRHSRRHFATSLNSVERLPVAAPELDRFVSDVRDLSHLALFPAYAKERREEFGFVAKRSSSGTLITARGSSKSDVAEGDLVVVTDVDLEHRTLNVASTGRKASLNASLAHLIFEARPDVHYIVHAHIPLHEGATCNRYTSPSTAEDWESIEPFVKAGETVIQQPHHGMLVLLERLEQIYDVLERNSVYHRHAEHYDAAYHKFLENGRLIDLAEQHLARGAKILDMACGTGEVSKLLLARGFSELTLADISKPMLRVAREKLGHVLHPGRFMQCSIQDLPPDGSFDGVVIRQAINYLPPGELVSGLSRLREALTPGGKLLFNSFDPSVVRKGQARAVREETGRQILITHAGNLVRDGKLYHGQRTEIFDSFTGAYELVYDLNSFWMYESEQFAKAAHDAGFASVEVTKEGNSVYFVCTR